MTSIDADELIAGLDRLGLRYLVGKKKSPITETIPPNRLLAGLSSHPDARMRHALIALLLYKPGFADFALAALEHLTDEEQVIFKINYTAALLLQQIYSAQLMRYVVEWREISDQFSAELRLPEIGTPRERLLELGAIQAGNHALTVNWSGTYIHIAESLISHFEWERAWAT